MALLIAAAFVIAGGIHYQTPMLARISAEFAASPAAAGWIPTLSFGGMLIGVALLVPLGDRISKRYLIIGMIAVLGVAQAVMMAAPSIAVLAAASLVTGITSAVGLVFISIAVEIAPPQHRGRAVGTQLMAMFIGILFARVAGGFIATHLGWRFSYGLSTAMLALLVIALIAWLPHTRPTTNARYSELLGSIFAIYKQHGTVRRAVSIQFLLGICYGGFWAVVAPMMAALHNVGPTQAGLIGIPGASGILVARPAGRWMDRAGATPVVTTGVTVMICAWLAFGFAAWSIAFVVLGAILLDCGLRTAMVANQTLVNSAAPDSRARANTIFGMHVWCGNAVGAFLTSNAFAWYGWLAVCAIAMTASITALLIHWGVLPIGRTETKVKAA
ncbi:MAG: MFS transporter [Betaproteobacteria bacterium]|nr:MFS transporter [Betaproteobacteria bacterium]